MRTIVLIALAVAIALPVAAQEPDWLTEARSREAKVLKLVKIKSQDNKFKATVAAKLLTKKIVEEKGSYSLAFDIGASSPLECELYPGGIDMGNQLRVMASDTFPYIEEDQGKIELKGIESTDAGLLDEWPFLAANWLYRVNDGKEAKLSALQQVVAEKGEAGISCSFIDFGYSKSIRRVMTSLLKSLQLDDAGPKAYYREVSVVEIAGKPVGVSRVRMTRDGDGDTRMVNDTSMLILAADGSPTSQDIGSLQWTRPDGSLINASQVDVENDEISQNLSLEMEEGEWRVTGTFVGKEFSAKIPGDQQPATFVSQIYALKKRLAAADAVGSEIQALRWEPSADPSRFVEARITVTKDLGNGRFAIRDSAGIVNIDYVAEAKTGNTITGNASIGPVEIFVRRVLRRGSF